MVIQPFIMPTIVASFKACRWALKKYKKKHESANTVFPLYVTLEEEQCNIERTWNKLAEVLGSKFAIGDQQAHLEINDINAKHMVYIRTVIIQHLEVTPLYFPPQSTLILPSPESHQRNSSDSPHRAPPPPPSQGPPSASLHVPPIPSQTPAHSLEHLSQQQKPHGMPPISNDWQLEASASVHEAAQKVLRVLTDLSNRLGYNSPRSHRRLRTSSSSNPSLSPSSTSSHTPSQFQADLVIEKSHPTPSFCTGALILQQIPQETIETITIPTIFIANSTLDEGGSASNAYICKHCFLELSSYHLSAQKWRSADWTSVARCHVLACPSFDDPRAGYVCWQCVQGQDGFREIRSMSRGVRVRRGAMGMLEHLEQCPYGKAIRDREIDAWDATTERNGKEQEREVFRDETEERFMRERGKLGGEPEEREPLPSYTDLRLEADDPPIVLPESPTSVLSHQYAYKGRREEEQGKRESFESDRLNKYNAVNGTTDRWPRPPTPHTAVPPRRPVPQPQPRDKRQ